MADVNRLEEGVATIADALGEAYQDAARGSAVELGHKPRRTLHRGIHREGPAYVVFYEDETGERRRRAYETLDGARAFERNVKLAPGALAEAVGAREWSSRQQKRGYVGELRNRRDRR